MFYLITGMQSCIFSVISLGISYVFFAKFPGVCTTVYIHENKIYRDTHNWMYVDEGSILYWINITMMVVQKILLYGGWGRGRMSIFCARLIVMMMMLPMRMGSSVFCAILLAVQFYATVAHGHCETA